MPSDARIVPALLAALSQRRGGVGPRVMLASERDETLALQWPEIEAVLPDGGLPRGVVELAAPNALGGATSVALAAVRAALTRDPRAYCGWIDAAATLHAPGVAMAGVDLDRLFVVRPPVARIASIAGKMALAKAFEVIVVDVESSLGARGLASARALEVLVRRLGLLAAEGGASILLLTDSHVRRATPLPTTMRLDLSWSGPGTMSVRVGRERRGRAGGSALVPFESLPGLASTRVATPNEWRLDRENTLENDSERDRKNDRVAAPILKRVAE